MKARLINFICNDHCKILYLYNDFVFQNITKQSCYIKAV